MIPLNELQKDYLTRLKAKLKNLQELKSLLSSEEAQAERQIRQIAHQISGSAGTYGFQDISDLARAMEQSSLADLCRHLDNFFDKLQTLFSSESRPAVLIIDDDEDINHLLRLHFEKRQWNVVTALTGQSALKIVDSGSFQLILLDLQLPDVDGRNLLWILIKNKKLAETRIFVLSAVHADSVKNECLSVGAAGFIQKPFNPECLLEQVLTGPSSTVAPTARPAPQTATLAKPGRPKILIADDDDLIISFVRHRLGRDDFEVLTALHGNEALRLAQTQSISLFILDIQMPGLNGLELLREIRRMSPYTKVPVMILSALGNEKDVSRAFEAGASDYLIKPFSPVELQARVRRLLNP